MYILVSQAKPKLNARIKLSGNLEDRNADLTQLSKQIISLVSQTTLYTIAIHLHK